MAAPTWTVPNPVEKYRLPTNGPTSPAASSSPLPTIAGPAPTDDAKPWHPNSSLFWVGALIAATVGLIGVSTSAKAGPVQASVKVGETGDGGK